MIVIRTVPWSRDFRETIDSLKRIKGCCDEVWFGVYGYPDLKTQEERANGIIEVTKELKEAGIRPVLEIGSNFGHSGETPETEVTKNFEKMTGIDGVAATGAFCPRGKNFLAYQKKVAEIFSRIKPWGMYLDDDLRLEFRYLVSYGCFCDRCIAEFNKKYGTDYTREELARRFTYDPVTIRRYVDHNRQALRDYAYMMASAVAKDNPDIYAGWENCLLGSYNGPDLKYVFEGFRDATKKPVMSRAGAFVYNDHSPRAVLDKVLNISYQNSILPKFVSIRRPEIENTSNTTMGKTIQGTCNEATLDLALGCNGLSFNMCSTGSEPIDVRDRMWTAFAEHRKYWGEIIKLGKNTGVSGMTPAYFPDVYLSVTKKKNDLKAEAAAQGKRYEEHVPPMNEVFRFASAPKEKGRELFQIGMPLSYEKKYCKAFLLHPDMVDFMSDKDIREMLSSNVLTCGETVIKLTEKGYGDSLPVEAKRAVGLHWEKYTDDPINGELAGKSGFTDQFTPVSFQTFTIKKSRKKDVRVLGVPESAGAFQGDSQKYETIMSCSVKTKEGGTWDLVGNSLWTVLINSVKRSFILNLCDHLTGGLAAYVKESEQVAVIPRVDNKGYFKGAVLQNISIGDTEGLTLVVRRPAGNTFRLVRPCQRTVTLPYVRKGDDCLVSIPPVAGWKNITVLCK